MEVWKYSPQRVQSFGVENVCRQVACGENHTVFLMTNKLVWTCGSNEFGQLGLSNGQDEAENGGALGGGDDTENKPQQIDKDKLDNVEFVAAGKYHTVVIRRKSEGDRGNADQ